MGTITVTINGQQYTGNDKDTALEICLANGIDVPRLCYCPGLSNVGSCRMCVVEIEGERRPVPSCTYPARDGMVMMTDTEQLEKYRRQILELIFTERNHFCMFCEASGDCELQKLAYRYQMDHVRYKYKFPESEVDTLSEYLVIDHNRCILCGRCVRACEEVAASQTIGFSKRGWETKVTADLSQSLGNSSCRLCGACIQSCPTGAIMNKLSYYRGTRDTCEEIETICPGCSVGCEINVLVKDNNIRKIESPDMTGSINGSLCRIGRFELLEPQPARITAPLVRNTSGELEETTLEEAVTVAAARISGKKTAGMVSPKLPTETLSSFKTFIKRACGNGPVDTTDGSLYRAITAGIKNGEKPCSTEATVEDLAKADYILLVGADPQKTNPVVSTVIRRNVNKTGAKLAIINEEADVLPMWSYIWLKPVKGSEKTLIDAITTAISENGWGGSGTNVPEKVSLADAAKAGGVDADDLKTIAREYGEAKKPVIVYGEEVLTGDGAAVSAIATLAEVTGNQKGIISLKPAINSRGAWEMGFAEGITEKPEGCYLLLGDDQPDETITKQLDGLDYVIVQASYASPATQKADVVFPSPVWTERSGSYTTIDGRSVTAQSVLVPVDGIKQDEEILAMIAGKIGHKTN